MEGHPYVVSCYCLYALPELLSFLAFLLMKTPPCFIGLVSYSYHIKVQGNLAVHKKILTRGMHTGYSWPSLTFDSLFFLCLGGWACKMVALHFRA